MNNKKVLITGTGRSGTTFLVALLTELGCDTGFSKHNYMNNVDEKCLGGLENNFVTNDNAYILKNPFFCIQIPQIIDNGFDIKMIYIPFRDISFVANSRKKHGIGAAGGVWLTDNPDAQEEKLYYALGKLISDVVFYSIPFEFINFDRMISSPKYLFEKLNYVISGISFEEFCAAYNKITPLFNGGEK